MLLSGRSMLALRLLSSSLLNLSRCSPWRSQVALLLLSSSSLIAGWRSWCSFSNCLLLVRPSSPFLLFVCSRHPRWCHIAAKCTCTALYYDSMEILGSQTVPPSLSSSPIAAPKGDTIGSERILCRFSGLGTTCKTRHHSFSQRHPKELPTTCKDPKQGKSVQETSSSLNHSSSGPATKQRQARFLECVWDG